MTLKVGMQHRVLEYNQVCPNDDPEITLTYFKTRSNLVLYAFVWDKGKTMDVLKLATDDRSDKKFISTSKLCPLVVCLPPAPWL